MDNESIMIGQLLEGIQRQIREMLDRQETQYKSLSDKTDGQTVTLVELRTQMTSLLGNGQPGRISNIESDVATLKKLGYYLTGALVSLAGAFTWLFRLYRLVDMHK